MKQVTDSHEQGAMLNARAVSRFVRISPRKVRLVLDLIRRKPVGQAFLILANTKRRAARVVEKILKSAAANAKEKKMNESKLVVRTAFADGGPTMKRFLPRAMGRADKILKRSAHITLVLEEGQVSAKQAAQGPKESKEGGVRKLFGGKEKKKEAAAGAAA